MRRNLFISGLLIWSALSAFPMLAATSSGITVLTANSSTVFPIVITKPGSYRLGSDVTVPAGVDGIDINAHDVTLDLNGFTVRGPNTCTSSGSTLSCTYSSPSSNGINGFTNHHITVRNGSVRGFGQYGIFLGDGARVEEVNAFENDYAGIVLGSGIVVDCVAGSNGLGGGINVANGQVRDSIANGNQSAGIYIFSGGASNNTANGNGLTGFFGDGYALISHNTALFNASGDLYNVRSNGDNSCTNGLC